MIPKFEDEINLLVSWSSRTGEIVHGPFHATQIQHRFMQTIDKFYPDRNFNIPTYSSVFVIYGRNAGYGSRMNLFQKCGA